MTEVKRIPAPEARGTVGIVHLGLGAFHRAHQAVYLERYRQRSGDARWGLCSANLRSNRSLVDSLRATGGRYMVAEYADSQHVTLRETAVLHEALFTGRDADGHWGRDLEALLARLCAPEVRIVTLTVTEKGYFLSPSEGRLLDDDPVIAADIATPEAPRSAPGILVAALALRRARGLAPFTVLCCDNMPSNGARTRTAVTELAARNAPDLARWIGERVAFPSSMVDRIVPAMTEADFQRLAALGVKDRAAVVCEAFSQWVVEDDFPQGRPDWEAEGVEMVGDVAPFETMKLRMLNGSHSLLAYLGTLDGVATVHEAVGRSELAALLHRYMAEEAAPTLEMPAGTDLSAYAERLLERFGNDSLRHRLHQIAMDGSQKLPQRWLQGAAAQLAAGGPIACTALGVAAWIRYTAGRDLQGRTYTVDDPMADAFARLHAAYGGAPRELVTAFLALDNIFPPAVAGNAHFIDAVEQAYRSLTRRGVPATLAALEGGTN